MATSLENIFEVEIKCLNTGETIKIDKTNNFHLVDIQGIESAVMESSLNSNILFDGSVATTRRINHRNIVIDVDYLGPNKLEARQKVIKMLNVYNNCLFSIRYGNNHKKIVCFTEELLAPPVNVYRPFNFRASLICPDPYMLDYDDTTTNLIRWEKALGFPLTIPNSKRYKGLVFGRRRKRQYVNLYNAGDVETGIILTLKATARVKKPFIINAKTREAIIINKTLEAGEAFIINTNPGSKGVEIINEPTGKKNGYRYITEDSSFMQLELGDNLIRYGAEEGVNNLDITIQHSNKYLGV